LIKLAQLEANFWVKIERDASSQIQSAQLGERISKLYLEGLIMNKPSVGYTLTKKGKEVLLSSEKIK
jgi:predicted transcriptional regulator